MSLLEKGVKDEIITVVQMSLLNNPVQSQSEVMFSN